MRVRSTAASAHKTQNFRHLNGEKRCIDHLLSKTIVLNESLKEMGNENKIGLNVRRRNYEKRWTSSTFDRDKDNLVFQVFVSSKESIWFRTFLNKRHGSLKDKNFRWKHQRHLKSHRSKSWSLFVLQSIYNSSQRSIVRREWRNNLCRRRERYESCLMKRMLGLKQGQQIEHHLESVNLFVEESEPRCIVCCCPWLPLVVLNTITVGIWQIHQDKRTMKVELTWHGFCWWWLLGSWNRHFCVRTQRSGYLRVDSVISNTQRIHSYFRSDDSHSWSKRAPRPLEMHGDPSMVKGWSGLKKRRSILTKLHFTFMGPIGPTALTRGSVLPSEASKRTRATLWKLFSSMRAEESLWKQPLSSTLTHLQKLCGFLTKPVLVKIFWPRQEIFCDCGR